MGETHKQVNNNENKLTVKVRVSFSDGENCVWMHYLDEALRDGLSEEVPRKLRTKGWMGSAALRTDVGRVF